MEGENPGRRYKFFRPREAARGYISVAGGSAFPSVYLFNNSSSHYLVVRDFQTQVGSGSLIYLASVRGHTGTQGGTIHPYVADMAQPAGQLWSDNAATAISPDNLQKNTGNSPIWGHDFPIGVIAPGWSMVFQQEISTATMEIGIIWEAILPDELDWLW
jgi:hypothetical protein